MSAVITVRATQTPDGVLQESVTVTAETDFPSEASPMVEAYS